MNEDIRRACVFAHFDKDNKVEEYVYYFLNELLKISHCIIFVTTSDISIEDVECLKSLNIQVIVRQNIGYDFYSYKVGIESLDMTKYDELIICNDSVYGPFFPLDEMFKIMQGRECDFWGVTASKSIAYHLQSYFIVYRKKIISSTMFRDFWHDLIALGDKGEVVKQYEVGLSELLFDYGLVGLPYVEGIKYDLDMKGNFLHLSKRLFSAPYKFFKILVSPRQYWSALKRKNSNTSLAHWEILLLDYKSPFIKVSLFTSNADNEKNIKNIERFGRDVSNYPIQFIKNHLNRII